MADLPRAREWDSTLAFLREGYAFVSRRCDALGSDVFRTRLMLSPVICMRGAEAARFFYGGGRMTRRRALPPHTLRLLQDIGSVQMLDGRAHRVRKSLFLAVADAEAAESLAATFEREWESALPAWAAKPRIALMDEIRFVLCRAACRWAGLELTDSEIRARTDEFGAMLQGAGSGVLRALEGLRRRPRTEQWARHIISALRQSGTTDTPAGTIAHHRTENGDLLTVEDAAVELINLLRPICAVDRYIAFTALAMHHYPPHRETIDDEILLQRFVEEVRRFYPFFPAVGGRLIETCEFKGTFFPAGTWILLDLYGTLHDPRLWTDAGQFRPERFAEPLSPYVFIPQGAGDPKEDHRCPGEALTVALMKAAARQLARLHYDVPAQDLRIDLARLPAEPASRFVMTNIRPAVSGSATAYVATGIPGG